MAIFDWKQSLNNRPTYGPTVSNAQKINLTPQDKLSILQYYKRKKNLFETNTKPSIMQNNGFKSFETPKPQVSTFSEPRDSDFGKTSSNSFYKPPQQEVTKLNSFVKFQQPKPITFPKIQSPFKPTPQQRSWDIEKNESEEKKISPSYFQAKSIASLDEKKEVKKPEVVKYSEPKQSTFYSDYLKKQKNPYVDTKAKFPLYNPYKQWNPKPIQSFKFTDQEFHEKIPVKRWKDDFGDLLKKQQSSNPNEKNAATSNIKIARNEQQEIVDKYHSLLPSRKQIVDTKIKELDESFHNKNNPYPDGQKLSDFVDSLNKEHLTSKKLENFAEFVKETRQKQLNVAKIEEPKLSSVTEQIPKAEKKQVERKVLTRADIVLDENDKKLSMPNQEKLIDEKLKWHNANTDEEREKATQQGKQIRETDKITPNNFSEYNPEKQRQYITELSQKSNIKLSEQEMGYLSDFLSNNQELKLNEKGDMVKVLQKVLPQIGFSDINQATGNYSEKTRASIASLVELVTGEKSDGSKIGNKEKAKLVQILSEIANGDTTITNKLKDKYSKNFNQARFDEVTGKNKVEEKQEGNNQQANDKKTASMLSDTFYNLTNKNNQSKEVNFAPVQSYLPEKFDEISVGSEKLELSVPKGYEYRDLEADGWKTAAQKETVITKVDWHGFLSSAMRGNYNGGAIQHTGDTTIYTHEYAGKIAGTELIMGLATAASDNTYIVPMKLIVQKKGDASRAIVEIDVLNSTIKNAISKSGNSENIITQSNPNETLKFKVSPNRLNDKYSGYLYKQNGEYYYAPKIYSDESITIKDTVNYVFPIKVKDLTEELKKSIKLNPNNEVEKKLIQEFEKLTN